MKRNAPHSGPTVPPKTPTPAAPAARPDPAAPAASPRPSGPRRRLLAVAAVAVVLAVAAIAAAAGFSGPPGPAASPTPTAPATAAPTASPTGPVATPTPPGWGQVRILDVGDVLLHGAVILGGQKADGTYGFPRFNQTLGSYVSAADISIFDMEGTLAGPPYTGFPSFSAPDAVAADLVAAGFDVAVTANNHCYDKGADGFLRTVQALRDAGLLVVGTRKDAAEPAFALLERNGIRVGISAYTWETVSNDGYKHVNGIRMSPSVADLLDSFYPSGASLDAAIERMVQREKDMRAAGAEVTVFVLHWGQEYSTTSVGYQRRIAQALCDAGADVVFGQHPHVVEEYDVLRSADGAHEMPVFYSIGNYIANDVFTTHNTKGYSEDELIASVTAVRGPDGSVRVVKGDFLPTYCLKWDVDGVRRHMAIPASDPLAGGSYERIQSVLAAASDSPTLPIFERFFQGPTVTS